MVGQEGGQRRTGTRNRFARWSAAAVALAVMVTGVGGPSPGLPTAGAGVALVAVGLAAGMSVVAAQLGPASVGLAVRRWRRRPCVDLIGSLVPLASPTTRGRSDVDGALSSVLVHGRYLLAVLEVQPPVDREDPLPTTYLKALTPLLDAGGIHVAEIRWVQSPGTRSAATGRSGRSGRPRTLVVFRIDVIVNEAAIRARGGDERGARSVVAVTVTRAVALLRSLGARPRLLDTTAALRAHAELGAPPMAHDRGPRTVQPPAPDHESRRQLRRSGRWYRLFRMDATTATPGPPWATERSSPRLSVDPADVTARLGRAGEAALRDIVTTSWIRAGPGGVVTGGCVRLGADAVRGLDHLERTLRERLGDGAGALRIAVDEQQPMFVDSLPLGGPGL